MAETAKQRETQRLSAADTARLTGLDQALAVAELSADGTISAVNENFAGLFGRPSADFKGQPLKGLAPADAAPAVAQLIEAAEGHGTAHEVIATARNDGETREIDLTLSWVGGRAKAAGRLIAFADDVTETLRIQGEAARLRGAVDSAQTAIMMVDRDFIVTYVNGSTRALLQQHEEEFRSVWPDFRADDILGTCIDRFHKDPGHQRRMLTDPARLPHRTDISVGRLRFSLTVSAQFDLEGNYIGNTLEWADVTELRRREDENTRLQAAVDGAQTAIMMVDRDFIVTYVNEETRALLSRHEETFRQVWPDFSADAIIGTCIDRFHKDPSHQRRMLDDPRRLPHRTDIKIGDLRFSLTVSAQMDPSGNYVGNTLEWADVTEMRKNEDLNAYFRSQIEAISRSQSMITFDLDGIVVDVNDNFCTVTGYAREEVVGQHHRMFVLPEEAQGHAYAQFWERLRRGEYVSGEFKRLGKGGRPIWIQGSYNAILGADGKPMRVVKFANDVTGRKSAVEQVTEILQLMAEGDLTPRIDEPLEGEFETIRKNVNSMLDRFGNTVSQILTSAEEVASAAAQISSGTADLSQRTETQAANLQETAASMEQLSTTVKQNAENAQYANEVSGKAQVAATEGGDIVAQAVEAMARISQSSTKIAEITSVIDGIAFQTNLLALNAAVEAARAGDAGRGFAVVATEVRNLAQRSAEAAKDITGLINESSAQVRDGVDLVNRTGMSLKEIVQSIKHVSDTVSQIAEASQEQSAGIEGINTAISQMDEMTQQNAALVEENAAAAGTLQDQAAGMNTEMQFFTVVEGRAGAKTGANTGDLGNVQAIQRSGHGHAAGKAVPHGASRPPAGPARRMQSVLAEAVQDETDWSEF